MMLGWPGVGKTPALIAMMLAVGRYHIHRRQEDDARPGWRRAKSLDNFRQQIGRVYEGIFLDDPNRDSISVSDLKSFLTVEEEQTTSGRYNDARLIRNAMRAYASNDLDQDDEPSADSRTFITGEEFLRLVRRVFAGDKHADVLACLKRAVVIVFGHHAMYLRLPSQDPGAKVHRIAVDELHRDLLAEKDKPLYSKYKLGIVEHGANWQEEVDKEVRMISDGMTKFAAGRPEAYISDINAAIEAELYRHLPMRFLPASPGASGSEDEPVLPPPPIIPHHAKVSRGRLGKFQYPPKKRVRTKSSQDKEDLDQLVMDAEEALMEPDLHAMPQDEANAPMAEDFSADEDAAAWMQD